MNMKMLKNSFLNTIFLKLPRNNKNINKILPTFSNKECSNTCFIGNKIILKCDLVDVKFSFDNADDRTNKQDKIQKKVKHATLLAYLLQKYGTALMTIQTKTTSERLKPIC
jgi:hypothetical protein